MFADYVVYFSASVEDLFQLLMMGFGIGTLFSGLALIISAAAMAAYDFICKEVK